MSPVESGAFFILYLRVKKLFFPILFISIVTVALNSCGKKPKEITTDLPFGIYLVDTACSDSSCLVSFSDLPTNMYCVFSKAVVPLEKMKNIYTYPTDESGRTTCDIYISDLNQRKIKEEEWNKKELIFVLIVNGKIIAQKINHEGFKSDNFYFKTDIIIDSLKKIMKPFEIIVHKADSVLTSRKKEYEWVTKYPSGAIKAKDIYIGEKLAGSLRYNETERIIGEWFTGLVIDTIDENGSLSRTYFENGKLELEEYHDGSHIVYVRSYYENGKMKYESLEFVTLVQQASLSRAYSANGQIEYRDSVVLLDKFPGQDGEFNNPQVIYIKHYADDKVVSEGAIFGSSAESEFDSCGTWKFYQNGKLISTKVFKSYKYYYDEHIKFTGN